MVLPRYKTVDTVEASELGLAPGYWPALITFKGRCWIRQFYNINKDSEVVSVEYLDGRELLLVIND